MFGRESRMLLRHYLEHGTSNSALARELGVSRDTIHRWMRSGDLDRDLDDLNWHSPTGWSRRPRRARRRRPERWLLRHGPSCGERPRSFATSMSPHDLDVRRDASYGVPRRSMGISSIGSGKTIVELCSAAMSVSVCR